MQYRGHIFNLTNKQKIKKNAVMKKKKKKKKKKKEKERLINQSMLILY
jgi:peptide methionine sulfoxide reductase MsrA